MLVLIYLRISGSGAPILDHHISFLHRLSFIIYVCCDVPKDISKVNQVASKRLSIYTHVFDLM